MNDKNKITAIILAAGSSSRMGKAKQLLPWKNSTLIEHVINEAINSKVNNIIVVLGANREKIISKIYNIEEIDLVENTNWQTGMLSSIKTGLKLGMEDSDGVIILLVDQPSVDSLYINKLIDTWQEMDKTIVATKYEANYGVPVIFSESHFSRIIGLKEGTGGAQTYLMNNKNEIVGIKPTFNIFDIDTEQQYRLHYSSLN